MIIVLKIKKYLFQLPLVSLMVIWWNLILKKKGPCYRCFVPELPDLENNCQTEGIFSPVAGVIGSLQANEVLKTILNIKNDLTSQLLVFDALKNEFRKLKVSFNPKCVNKCSK